MRKRTQLAEAQRKQPCIVSQIFALLASPNPDNETTQQVLRCLPNDARKALQRLQKKEMSGLREAFAHFHGCPGLMAGLPSGHLGKLLGFYDIDALVNYLEHVFVPWSDLFMGLNFAEAWPRLDENTVSCVRLLAPASCGRDELRVRELEAQHDVFGNYTKDERKTIFGNLRLRGKPLIDLQSLVGDYKLLTHADDAVQHLLHISFRGSTATNHCMVKWRALRGFALCHIEELAPHVIDGRSLRSLMKANNRLRPSAVRWQEFRKLAIAEGFACAPSADTDSGDQDTIDSLFADETWLMTMKKALCRCHCSEDWRARERQGIPSLAVVYELWQCHRESSERNLASSNSCCTVLNPQLPASKVRRAKVDAFFGQQSCSPVFPLEEYYVRSDNGERPRLKESTSRESPTSKQLLRANTWPQQRNTGPRQAQNPPPVPPTGLQTSKPTTSGEHLPSNSDKPKAIQTDEGVGSVNQSHEGILGVHGLGPVESTSEWNGESRHGGATQQTSTSVTTAILLSPQPRHEMLMESAPDSGLYQGLIGNPFDRSSSTVSGSPVDPSWSEWDNASVHVHESPFHHLQLDTATVAPLESASASIYSQESMSPTSPSPGENADPAPVSNLEFGEAINLLRPRARKRRFPQKVFPRYVLKGRTFKAINNPHRTSRSYVPIDDILFDKRGTGVSPTSAHFFSEAPHDGFVIDAAIKDSAVRLIS